MLSYAGRNRRTVNLLKTIYFDRPEWTPASVGLLPAVWLKHREAIEDLVLEHPKIWPGFKKGQYNYDTMWSPLYELGLHTDCWGCTWENVERGMDSIVIGHPLENWDNFKTWQPPNPETDNLFSKRDWDADAKRMAEQKQNGHLAQAGPLFHGFGYMLLYFLRGFENLMMDFAVEDPRLDELIAIITRYNATVTKKCLDLGGEHFTFGEDLGTQKALPISPATWRRYIKPMYRTMWAPVKAADLPIFMHSDGHILEIIPDLIEVGVKILNPQPRPNGLSNLAAIARGKVALWQDCDRQLFPFATPSQLEDHIAEVHDALNLPTGGLMLSVEIGPDVPLQNVDALCKAVEKVCKLPEPSVV